MGNCKCNKAPQVQLRKGYLKSLAVCCGCNDDWEMDGVTIILNDECVYTVNKEWLLDFILTMAIDTTSLFNNNGKISVSKDWVLANIPHLDETTIILNEDNMIQINMEWLEDYLSNMIPEIPEKLPNPYIFEINAGTKHVVYDGSDAKKITITPEDLALEYVVKTFNGVSPDLDGNLDYSVVTSINGLRPDESGLLELMPEDLGIHNRVQSVNNIFPDSDGNVDLGNTFIQVQHTTDYTIQNTENNIPNISITVPKNGYYKATLRLNVKKISGGGTSTIYVKGKVNGLVAPNGARNIETYNDGELKSLEFTFTGHLNQGDILTCSLIASSTGNVLKNAIGYIGAQFDLQYIKE